MESPGLLRLKCTDGELSCDWLYQGSDPKHGPSVLEGEQGHWVSKPPALQGDRVAYCLCKRVGGHRRETFEIREVMKGPFDGRAGSSRPAIPSQCEGFACRGEFDRIVTPYFIGLRPEQQEGAP